MTDAELAARQVASSFAGYGTLARAAPTGRALTFAGGRVQAAITPERPERSIVNSVVYAEGPDLVASLPQLQAVYDEAGIVAWTVWVHPGDEETAAALARARHRLDGRPMLMAAALEEMDLAPRAELDLDPEPTWRTVALLNDAAYGIPAQLSFAAALADPIAPEWRVRVARVDGRPAACAVVLVHETNAWVGLVATAPAAQGRGLCSELLRGMLREAAEGGAETTTLEGSAMGEAVYARLGYRSLGRLQMWERRTF